MTAAPGVDGELPGADSREEEHVILVAVTAYGESWREAEAKVISALEARPTLIQDLGVLSWWIADDRRTDGSDNDSAIFVKPGATVRAAQLLESAELTDAVNIPVIYLDDATFPEWSPR